jgi:transposase
MNKKTSWQAQHRLVWSPSMREGLSTQEVCLMLAVRAPRRNPSTRDPFRPLLWDDNHPEFRRIDAILPPDHHARWLVTVVSRLKLAPLRCSYTNRGSLAYLPELLLPFVLFMYSNGILSPAKWVKAATYDDQTKWLLRGFQPSRSHLYTFRDRLGPYLDDWHAQIVAWAVYEKLNHGRERQPRWHLDRRPGLAASAARSPRRGPASAALAFARLVRHQSHQMRSDNVP